jgi:glycerophosphoryl diester phosphodiesterase
MPPIIVAHRGESYDAPENTLASMQLAWERGAQAIETDIRLSSDHQIVAIHDDNTLKTAGKDCPVDAQTFAQLRELDAGSYKGEKWTGEKIPTLTEILQTIPPEGKISIEIKAGLEIIQPLAEILSQSQLNPQQICLIAFDFEVLIAARSTFPSFRTHWLIDLKNTPDNRGTSLERAIHTAQQNHVTGLDIGVHIDPENTQNINWVKGVKKAGLELYAWTVNDVALAKNLIDAGIDGITSDRAQWLREQL